MSSGTQDADFARLWKIQTTVGKLVLDGKRQPGDVADVLQRIVDEAQEKFALLADLGIITVPADYEHATWLARFKMKHQGGRKKAFYYYNDAITDENFANPSRILRPGDKLWVRVFAQRVHGTTTSEERMDFLRGKQAVFTGAQGSSLVFEQKRDQLPKGKWYASFDEKERLPMVGGYRRVPGVGANSDGDFYFSSATLRIPGTATMRFSASATWPWVLRLFVRPWVFDPLTDAPSARRSRVLASQRGSFFIHILYTISGT